MELDLIIMKFFLQEYLDKEMSKEFKKDAAIAGGALLVFGGLLGLGFALAKK